MPTREAAERELVRRHFELEDGLTRVFRIRGPGETPTTPSRSGYSK